MHSRHIKEETSCRRSLSARDKLAVEQNAHVFPQLADSRLLRLVIGDKAVEATKTLHLSDCDVAYKHSSGYEFNKSRISRLSMLILNDLKDRETPERRERLQTVWYIDRWH